MRMTPGTPFGPWRAGLDPVERACQLRSLQALSAVFLGSSAPVVAALRDAEADPTKAADALQALDAIPALTRRRLLTTFGAVTYPDNKPRKLRSAS
jgi:hypothetical protein